MLIIEMTEQTRDELLKEIKRILNDVQNYKYKGVGELFRSLDVLENFVNNLEIGLMEHQ